MRQSFSFIAITVLSSILPLHSSITAEQPAAYQQNYTTQNAPMGGTGVMDVNTRSFQQALAASSKPIVLVFSAQWCRPCQSMKPILEEIARETPEVTFLRVDFDASPELVQSYNIDSIPALLYIRPDGYVVDRTIGFSEKQQLKGRVQAFANSMRKK